MRERAHSVTSHLASPDIEAGVPGAPCPGSTYAIDVTGAVAEGGLKPHSDTDLSVVVAARPKKAVRQTPFVCFPDVSAPSAVRGIVADALQLVCLDVDLPIVLTRARQRGVTLTRVQ